MAVKAIGVRNKAVSPRARRPVWHWMLAAVFLAALASLIGYDTIYGRLGLIGPQSVFEINGKGKVIKVPPGGNVQAAIERAESGDIVELQAGAVYSGTVNLPNKPLTDYVTIRSSAAAELPIDVRVSPSQRAKMATIVAGILGRPAVSAANGANHYRFVGIEFTSASTLYNYNMVLLGNGETRPDKVPHDIEIDRSYLHPNKTGVARRGIALNSANTTIKNSYIEGFGFPGEETQGICGWTGTHNVKILNNYIEGGAENIMFGGGDPANAELIPSDIEIRGNHLNKPAEWKKRVTVKTLLELKNAKRVQFVDNLLTNNWEGSAFRITIRNQDGGAPFSTIEDVLIKDNIIDGAGEGVNILGKDDTYPSQTLKRLTIENNLFLNLTGGNGFEGSGYFVQINDGEDITIANNTVFNTGNTATFHGAIPRSIVFRDNIFGHGTYGIHGLANINSPAAQKIFDNNIIVNNLNVEKNDASFPPNNLWVNGYGSVGFVNIEKNDFNLSPASKFKNRGVNKTDIGCDVKKLRIRIM